MAIFSKNLTKPLTLIISLGRRVFVWPTVLEGTVYGREGTVAGWLGPEWWEVLLWQNSHAGESGSRTLKLTLQPSTPTLCAYVY